MKQNITTKIFQVLLGLALSIPMLAAAHGSGGYVEKIEGNYLVDIGYTNPALKLGDSNRFDFGLFNTSNGAGVDFDTVWVRFVQDGNPVFIGNLPRLGLNAAVMTYTFPNSGNYTMTVNYLKNQQTLVQTDFPLTVNGPTVPIDTQSKPNLMNIFGYIVIGFIVGFIVARVIKKK